MRRLLALFIAITLISCKTEPKDYATVSGKIENFHESKTIKFFKGREYEKVINLNDDGTFSDTLKIEAGDYNFQHGNQYGQIYLENNFESSFTTDFKSFAKSIVFEGDASDTNNFAVQSFLIVSEYFDDELITNGNQTDLDNALKNYKSAYNNLKEKYKDVDSTHLAFVNKNVERTAKQLENFMKPKIALRAKFPKGGPSPNFVDYENYSGGNTSLQDLKGKYLYIDIWATWCGPCIKEIPALKRVEKQFENKNIQFLSISVDDGRGYKNDAGKAYLGWKKMISEKQLGGIQLLADNGFRSSFIEDYDINGIPRFIVIDPEGKIVSADAPRPSNPKLIELFNSLNL